MADLSLSTTGTPATKQWLNITSGSVDTGTLIADSVDIKTIETNSLTLVEQKAVPNPAVGSVTLFVDSVSGMLNSQDSLGNTLPYVPTSGALMTGPLQAVPATSIIIPDSNNNIALGSVATGTSCVMLGLSSSFAQAPNCISIGTSVNTDAQYAVAVGDNIAAFNTAFSSVSLGGGNTGILNHQQYGVAMPADNTLLAGNYGIAIGQAAGVGAVNNAISVGQGAVNNTAHSALLGDAAIVNIRPNNASLCDLGSSVSPFKTTWLRDAAPASGCKYSQYGSVTVTNTAADTSYATGTHVGSLVISANQTPGTIYRFKGNFAYSEILADSSTFRVKVNGNPLVAMVVGPGLFVSQGLDIEGAIVVLGGGNAQCELRVLLESEPVGITNATSAWNQAIANTLDFSVQYNAADPGNTLVCNFLYVETLFAQ
jgi:hypothetical protein